MAGTERSKSYYHITMPSIQEFWNLLSQSTLVTAEQVAELQDEFSKLRGAGHGNALVLAEWLVADGVIMRYHADVLMAGRDGPFRYGDFLVTERIRRGRLKGCFRAIHEPTQHPVLIVFLSSEQLQQPALWPAIAKTSEKEFTANSEHVSTLHELVDLTDYRFAVYEDLRGTALSDVLAGGTSMSVAQAATIAHSVAKGLSDLHDVELPHGDVRPHNIWLDEQGNARLLGVPLALASLPNRPPLDSDQADYAAPEINPQHPTATHLADIYALGCTLYELLAGRPPFNSPDSGQGVNEKLQRHALDPIVPLHQLGNTPESVNQIVSYMMAKNQSVRYASIQTIVEAISQYTDEAVADRNSGKSPVRLAYENVAAARRSAAISAAAYVSPPQAPTVDPTPMTETPPAETPMTETPPAIDPTTASAITAVEEIFQQFGAPLASGPTPLLRDSPDGAAIASRPSARSRRTKAVSIALATTIAVAASVALIMIPGPEEPLNGNQVATGAPTTDGNTDGADPAATDGETDSDPQPPPPPDPNEPYENLIPDDGVTLWGSPTRGNPPDIRYLPSNPQVLFLIRTARLLEHRSGKKMVDALGPAGQTLATWIAAMTGFQPEEIDRLDVALYEGSSEHPKIVLVVRLLESLSIDQLTARWNDPTIVDYNGGKYYRQGNRGYYLPAGRTDVFTVGDIESVHEVVDFLDEVTWLESSADEPGSSPMDRLRQAADADRHVNILFSQNYVRSARESLYLGQLAPLHGAISWLLGPSEEIQAGLLSFHVADSFFTELRLFGVRDKRPDVLADQVYQRIGEVPRRLNAHLFELSISPYSRPLLAALPDMSRSLYLNTRHDRNRLRGRQAVLRCYLPIGAASNLTMAAELALHETAGTSSSETSTPTAAKTVREKLRQSTSLVFERDNLSQVLAALSADIGVAIELQGNDLELDGITKNQSFGINMRNKPAEEILVQIMLLANPDQTVTRPSDPNLKLVFVIKEKLDGGNDVIWVTTRSAAAARGDTLPVVFNAGS